MGRMAYLIQVDPVSNHNKFYSMIENGGIIDVEYGRVDSKPRKQTYPIEKWDSIYRSKIKSGYTDKTKEHYTKGDQDLVKESNEQYKPIEDDDIRKLVEELMSQARQVIDSNYNIKVTNVTEAMIKNAENKIKELIDIVDAKYSSFSLTKFNNVLVELFQILPRKMKNVKDYLATCQNDMPTIVQKEDALLSTMKGQYQIQEQKRKQQKEATKAKNENLTILEAMGIEICNCTAKDIEKIKKEMGEDAKLFVKGWVVKNKRTTQNYKKFVKDFGIEPRGIKLYWHGSKTENWWSIVNNGLSLKPNAVITGKMFGNGIYFAPKAAKSINYTSLRGSYWASGTSDVGYMALYNVACGKPYETDHTSSKFRNFGFDDLKYGCTCVYAHAGNHLKNDEVIVYREDQVDIKYIVKIGRN